MEKVLDKVAIIGAGTMGAQIAMMATHAGYRVRIFDPQEGAFSRAVDRFRSHLQSQGVTPSIPWELWEQCQAAIEESAGMEQAVLGADLVIEAVPEDLELKRSVFRQLGREAPPQAILATNSSSIPVSRLEDSCGRPEQCLNIHFYAPLQGLNIVDVMGGTRTLPQVMEKGVAWVKSLGCVPLTVKKELLGFCFNRVWRAIKREVLYMWANGFVDFRDIDRAWMIFTGMKVGPFGLMDSVGLDVVWDIEMVYYRESGDPRDHPPAALKEKIERGELGQKSGRGFYSYPHPAYLEPGFLKTGEGNSS